MLRRGRGALKPDGPLWLLRHITGIATKRHHSTRVLGSHFVLDDGRSRKQTARFQDLLQQLSHAYLTRRANAGYAPVTTNRESPLVSVATSLSRPISDPHVCLTFQGLGLTAVSGQPLQKPGMKSSGVCDLSCSGLPPVRSESETHLTFAARLPAKSAQVSIRQLQAATHKSPRNFSGGKLLLGNALCNRKHTRLHAPAGRATAFKKHCWSEGASWVKSSVSWRWQPHSPRALLSLSQGCTCFFIACIVF